MRGYGRASTLVLLAVTLAALVFASTASADRAFSSRFSDSERGDITMAGNTLITCRADSLPNCADRQAGIGTSLGNAGTPRFVDTDGDAATFSSSSANLNLPAGAQVLFAGLYWGGRADMHATQDAYAVTPAQFGAVKLRTPAAPGYQNVTASIPVDQIHFGGAATNGVWQGFADVTPLVQAGGPGSYTVADVLLEGTRPTSNGSYGGWGLIVAYTAPSEPFRNLVVFDGLVPQASSSTATDIALSGFLTPPAPANVQTSFGVIAYEGDRGFTGDRLRVIQTPLNTSLSDALTPAADFFNSTISRSGVDAGDRNPAYANQMGIDAKLISATNALANSTSSATVRLSTSGDGYAPGAITTATDLFTPDLTPTKQIANVTDPGQPAEPNDVLEYTITYANAPTSPASPVDSAADFVITDPIPANLTYVGGSLEIVSGNPGAGARTDTAGDDEAEFDGGNVVFRVGSGANTASGGTIGPGEQVTVRFRAQVDTGSPGHLSTNEATGSFRAVTLNQAFDEVASASIPVIPVHDLSLDKSAPTTVLPGQNLTYTLNVANDGPSTSDQTTLTDTLPAGLTFLPSPDSDSRCTAVLQDVTCNLGSLAGDGSDDTTVAIVAAVDPNTSGFIQNHAEVTDLGSTPEADPDNNDDVAITEVVPASDLRLTKTAPAGPHQPGADITYTLSVTNDGPNGTPSARVIDTLPDGLTYISDDASCDIVDLPEIRCDLGAIANGDTVSFHVTARLPATPDTTVTNAATVSGPNEDPTSNNNGSTASAAIAPAPAAPAPPATDTASERRCFFGRKVTILGTNGPDRIVGTPGPDVIDGRGGDDVIIGRGGHDFICGGRGDDLIKAGRGNDAVKGGPGDDRIIGNKGSDWLRGGPGDDRISGRSGNDRLMGNAGDDRLQGGRGNDLLFGGPGRDWAKGGPGHDKGAGITFPFGIERPFRLGNRPVPCPDRICEPD